MARGLLSTALWLMACTTATAQHFLDLRQGNDAYNRGNYGEAKKKYEKVMTGAETFEEKKEAVFNTGNALYKEKQFDDAMKQYESVAKNESLDKSLRADAFYNIANSIFKKAKAGTPEQRPDALREALAHYKQALALNPKDADAKHNYEFARAMLRELEQKQQQKKDQNKNDQKNDDKKNDQDKPNDEKNDKRDDQKQQQDQQKQDQQEQQSDPSKEEPKPAKPEKTSFSRAEAERILNALKEKEKDMLKKYQVKKTLGKAKPEKDW